MVRLRRPLATLLALAAPSLGAQQPADTARLRPVVVTATRTPIDPAAAPASIAVLSGDELRARGMVRVADALADVPGLTLATSGSFGATTSLFARGGNSGYVKVLIDGVAVNNPGGAFDFAHLTTDNVERIEILRGPASVVYGSDAVTGVVQIFTRRGTGPTRGTLSIRAGSFGAREGSGEMFGGGARAAYSVGAAARETNGIFAFNNDYRSRVASGRLSLVPSTATTVDLTVRRVNATYHFPTDGAGNIVDSNAVRDDRRTVGGMSVAHRLTPRAELRLQAGASRLDGESSNRPDSPGDSAGFYGRDDSRIDRRSADVRADLRPGGAIVLSVGAELQREQVDSRSESQFMRFPPAAAEFREHRTNRAAYAQLVGTTHGRLTYTASARVDRDATFGTFITGRGSVAWQALGRTTVRAAAGNAFKAPAFEETFSSAFTIGNPALDPERSVSWELSAEQRAFGGRLTIGATWFDQRFRDLIQYVSGDASTDFRGTNLNLAAASSRGLELEARAPSLGRLSVGASYSALRTRVTDAGTGAFGTFVDGERLLRRPAHSATLDATYRIGGSARVAAVARHVGKRDDRDFAAGERVTLPAHTTVDVSGELALERWAAPLAPLTVTARVENLFDRDYAAVFNFPAPGRTVLVGARVELGPRD